MPASGLTVHISTGSLFDAAHFDSGPRRTRTDWRTGASTCISYLVECALCILGFGWAWLAVRCLLSGFGQNPGLDLVALTLLPQAGMTILASCLRVSRWFARSAPDAVFGAFSETQVVLATRLQILSRTMSSSTQPAQSRASFFLKHDARRLHLVGGPHHSEKCFQLHERCQGTRVQRQRTKAQDLNGLTVEGENWFNLTAALRADSSL